MDFHPPGSKVFRLMPPEAPEDIEQLLLVEGDLSTKRNAFLMLLNCDQEYLELRGSCWICSILNFELTQ